MAVSRRFPEAQICNLNIGLVKSEQRQVGRARRASARFQGAQIYKFHVSELKQCATYKEKIS